GSLPRPAGDSRERGPALPWRARRSREGPTLPAPRGRRRRDRPCGARATRARGPAGRRGPRPGPRAGSGRPTRASFELYVLIAERLMLDDAAARDSQTDFFRKLLAAGVAVVGGEGERALVGLALRRADPARPLDVARGDELDVVGADPERRGFLRIAELDEEL